MNDRVVGVFTDRAAADEAASKLTGSGVDPGQVSVKKVLQQGHRGFADSEKVHSLIHSPEIRESDNMSEKAGTVILIIEVPERPEEPDNDDQGQDSAGLDPHDPEALRAALEDLGATDTEVVEATPGLDL